MKCNYKKWQGTSAERKAMMTEINRQCAEYEEKHGKELMNRALWVLYSEFGFGEKRLKRFADAYNNEIKQLVEHYELEPEDDVFLCTRKLKDAGITI